MDNDRDTDRIRHPAEEFMNAAFTDPDRRAVIRGHDHHHGGAALLGTAAALRADLRCEMGRSDDHWHPAADMLEHRVHHLIAFVIGQYELLGKICKDAESVRSGIDHEVHAAALSFEIEFALVIENRRDYREHP